MPGSTPPFFPSVEHGKPTIIVDTPQDLSNYFTKNEITTDYYSQTYINQNIPLRSELNSLEDTLKNDFTVRADGLDSDIEELDAKINTEIQKVNTEHEEKYLKIADATNTYATLGKVFINGNKITANETAITSNAGNISSNATNIGLVTTQAGANATAISSNATNIGLVTTQAGANATAISTLDSRVDNEFTRELATIGSEFKFYQGVGQPGFYFANFSGDKTTDGPIHSRGTEESNPKGQSGTEYPYGNPEPVQDNTSTRSSVYYVRTVTNRSSLILGDTQNDMYLSWRSLEDALWDLQGRPQGTPPVTVPPLIPFPFPSVIQEQLNGLGEELQPGQSDTFIVHASKDAGGQVSTEYRTFAQAMQEYYGYDPRP